VPSQVNNSGSVERLTRQSTVMSPPMAKEHAYNKKRCEQKGHCKQPYYFPNSYANERARGGGMKTPEEELSKIK